MNIKLAVVMGIFGLASLPALAQEIGRALPASAPEPASNVGSPAKTELGRMLFFDKRLSESSTVSCATCHSVTDGGVDRRPASVGVHGQTLTRSAPTIWNVGFLTSYFWDSHASTLEEQAVGQLLNPVVMGMKDEAYVAARVQSIAGYKPYFEHAFGQGDVVTTANVAKAIAAFERTLVTSDAPFDRYANGDKTAMTDAQVRGMHMFKDVGCLRCHQGPTFGGPIMREGAPYVMKFPTHPESPFVSIYGLNKDQGRYEWTGKVADRNMWRVPTLRNLKFGAPYMHNGSVASLPDAVRVMGSTELARTLTDTEVADLVSFLDSLSGKLPVVTEPVLPK